ncbi:unnamed protein product, partial [Staurois parvus]
MPASVFRVPFPANVGGTYGGQNWCEIQKTKMFNTLKSHSITFLYQTIFSHT